MTASSIAIVWLRDDLRLRDNPALHYAWTHYDKVWPLYILEEERDLGSASAWWLHRSLETLAESLAKNLNSALTLRRGSAAILLPQLVDEYSGGNCPKLGVFWNRRYAKAERERDGKLMDTLKQSGTTVKSFKASLLWEPWEIKSKQGGSYHVFTPFWKTCKNTSVSREELAIPRGTSPAPGDYAGSTEAQAGDAPVPSVPIPSGPIPSGPAPRSDDLNDWGLLPKAPNWALAFEQHWQPGETGAWRRLETFLSEEISEYANHRDTPSRAATSRLSPHLRFGEISPLSIWNRLQSFARDASADDASTDKASHTKKNVDKFLSEVGWREFSYSTLYDTEALREVPIRREFASFPWEHDEGHLRAWQRGQTGYPIVDAGLRQLWRTGWMHNRVRMIVASFLVKHLLIPWQEGEKWFWDTLVDADEANNAASWQWVAGCGRDAAPYFRIFNPILQGERFDKEGGYVRTFVPELAALPNKWIHKPWQAPESVLTEAQITLGKDYPHPVVDHSIARKRALAAFDQIKQKD